jgi:NADH dehydrogenase
MVEARRVTVFGGSGFIGRHVVRRLARGGDVVTVVARHDAPFLQPMGGVGQIVLRRGNFGDTALMRQAVAGADAVVNLVGILAETGGQRFDAIQHQGAGRIAEAAAAAGVARMVQISAIGADQSSRSLYARTKALGEAAVASAFPAATILRPSIVFGPEDRFFNRFAAMARHFDALPLIGGGTARFQPVYVGDVADAVLAALARPDARGRIYELGGPEVLSFRALMTLMLHEIGRPNTLLIPLPFAVASVLAFFAEHAPGAPLTRDQVVLLRADNVVAATALSLSDLGVPPTPLGVVLSSYLARYRKREYVAV